MTKTESESGRPIMTLDDTIQHATDSPLDPRVTDAFCTGAAISIEEFCDRVSRTVAVRYILREYIFEFCDGVVNEIYAYMLRTHEVIPSAFSMSVFLAFDDGEYAHTGDPPGPSSEELYTRPRIAEILAGGKAT